MGQPAPRVAVPGGPGTRRGLSLCSVIKSEWCKRRADPWCFGGGDDTNCVCPQAHLARSMSRRGHLAAEPSAWPSPWLPCEPYSPGGLVPLPVPLQGEPKVELTCFPKVRRAVLSHLRCCCQGAQ